ncbi:Uncharacterized FAD-linked oxidoreductase YitY [Seminavis robusta]|uniref:Uncharacterized FAD-linked oxidoreductase YitY n=1 Tax=Seminavis robusta TaxID=568900 RepID=A0A9N8H300_9STRA|nr:Uncharacterized FAD-linked oxidoreductase YitY [Seminavis robusta]|eukprot:Sro27_g018490.1 Uncharacterized FAD-linked oxidoreductase YitY (1714) ;mRNA; f:172103-177244
MTTSEKDRDFDPLDGCVWPDPNPVSHGNCQNGLLLNDVSGLSETLVSRIFFPKTTADVESVLKQALDDDKRIGIRGTQHSMGGQSLQRDGYILDMKYLDHYQYSAQPEQEEEDVITVGTGCTWATVIRALNPHGKSPCVLQSYCNFSVGGTLSVNAHGITSDDTMASCVRSFVLVHYDDAQEGMVRTTLCTPQHELFSLALGGYGLFGVITEVTLAVTDNSDLILDSLKSLKVTPPEASNADPDDPRSEFERIWDACREDPSVDIKLARLNILTLETASLYVFRKDGLPVASRLPMRPKEISAVGRLLYKWALPLLKDYRQYREETQGQAIDMPPHNHETTRNEVLWESATPLSKLYTPFMVAHDSFVLQEFFVPQDQFQPWIQQARPIFQEIDAYQKQGTDQVPPQSLVLLNTTIRYVNQDAITALPYSYSHHHHHHQKGCYAFVLYYRIRKTPPVELDLGNFHNRLAEIAVGMGGTFYLPYRKCYDSNLLRQAYPQIEAFAKKKELHDPRGIFSNAWFEHYLLPMCSAEFQAKWTQDTSKENTPEQPDNNVVTTDAMAEEDFVKALPRNDDPDLTRRSNSFRKLLRNRSLLKQFEQEFLVHVFHIASPADVTRIMAHAAADPRNRDDADIYKVVYDYFQKESSPVTKAQRGWRGIRQLCRQKAELTHQTAAMLHRLGLLGCIRSYVSLGDHGKTVRSFQEAQVFASDYQVWIAHKFEPDDETSLNVVLERCGMDPVGEKVPFDYLEDEPSEKLSVIPSGVVDLVTINQGLHHMPPSKLYGVLSEVYRMLAPGGLFIFREHDLRLEPSSTSGTNTDVAMLDMAHSIFNAVTGVSPDDEASEIRAFRPLTEWRDLCRRTGFVDTMLYGLEVGDCTYDFMLCFRKEGNPETIQRPADFFSSQTKRMDPPELPIFGAVRTLLSQVPAFVGIYAADGVNLLLANLPRLRSAIDQFILCDLPEALQADARCQEFLETEQFLEIPKKIHGLFVLFVNKLQELGTGAKSLLDAGQVRQISNIAGLLSMKEVWLILPTIKRRSVQTPEAVERVEQMVLEFVEENIPMLLQVGESKQEPDAPANENAASPGSPEADESVTAEEVMLMIETLQSEIPGILDPKVVLPNSGFTLTQQSALVGASASSDLHAFAERVAWLHDRSSFTELRDALVGPNQSVLQTKHLPTKDRLLSPQHPWHRSMIAFFKGPRVILNQSTLFGVRMVGLSDFIDVYNEAKTLAQREQARRAENASGLSSDAVAVLQFLTKEVSSDEHIKEVSIRFDAGGSHGSRDLFDVGEILFASFGYSSLTSKPSDVTNELKDLQRSLALGRRSASGAGNPIVTSLMEEPHAGRPGWLPVREEILKGFRNRGNATQAGDSARRFVVKAGTLGMAGSNNLKVQYRPLWTSVPAGDVANLCQFAQGANLVDPTFHANDGHYMWFKLPEWMQVEVISKLATSLDHTPWYYFPFSEFMANYFRVLLQVCLIVSKEYGLVTAYASVPFFYDLVPGIIMSALFAQLQALAVPITKALEPPNEAVMVEEILFLMPFDSSSHLHESPQSLLKRLVDSRIRSAHLICKPISNKGGMGLYRMVVPTYKAMGEILVQMALALPSARLLQISNQQVVQVLLAVSLEEEEEEGRPLAAGNNDTVDSTVRKINNVEGLEVVMRFQYPADNIARRLEGETKAREVHLAVKAQVCQLLTLLHMVSWNDRITVKQIYDFWA